MSRSARTAVALALGVIVLAGCRGSRSERPPLHLVGNMDQQQRYDTQEANPFHGDGRAMRPPVANTVAVGQLHDDEHLNRALGRDGKLVDSLPAGIDLDERRRVRGRERYTIFCAPCHDAAGTGRGIVVKRGMVTPPSLLEADLRQRPLGHLYQVIARGVRNMSSHAAQIPVPDRWAIAAYVRALQLGRDAGPGLHETVGLDSTPSDDVSEEGWN